MITRQQIIAFIEQSGGADSNSVAKHFGISADSASARLSIYHANGYLNREIGRLSEINKKPIWKYTPNQKVDVAMTKQQRIATVTSPLANDKGWLDFDKIASNIAEALVAQIAGRVKSKVESSLGKMIAAQFGSLQLPSPNEIQAPQISSQPSEPVEQKKRPPTVGVIGMIPIQNAEVMAEFGDILDLRFASTDQLPVVKQIAKSADICFVHTKHCSHNVDNILKSVGVEYEAIGGSLSQMKEALQNYCNSVTY